MWWKHFLGYSSRHGSSQSSGGWTPHTHTLACVWLGDIWPFCVPLSPLFNAPSSLCVTHTCRVSVVRVKGWPLFIQAWLWSLIPHTYCFALWASIMAKLTGWKTSRNGGNLGNAHSEAKTRTNDCRLLSLSFIGCKFDAVLLWKLKHLSQIQYPDVQFCWQLAYSSQVFHRT